MGFVAIPVLSWVARVWQCSEQICELGIFLLIAFLGGRQSGFLSHTDLITSIHCFYHLHVQSALVSVAVYLP